MSKLVRFALVAALAATGFGCSQQQNAANPAAPAAALAPTTPDAAVAVSIKALRDNNVAALIENALPAPEAVKLKADWNKDMNSEPITDEDRKEFAEKMAALTAPDAEAKNVVVRRIGEPIQMDAQLMYTLRRAGVQPGAVVSVSGSPGGVLVGSGGEAAELGQDVASHVFVAKA